MDSVAPGDVILHYSSNFLRATSTAQSVARPAQNPLGSDSWERDGRIVDTQYRELSVPIALASIPAHVRVPQSGPFTSVGSVQQGYLYRVDDTLAGELADSFPELREILADYVDLPPEPVTTRVTPRDLHDQFAAAVSMAGLKFDDTGNLIRSFLSSVLAKPFVILTGLSGSGKTQLAMRLGEWFGRDSSGRPRSLVVPVRPDWTSPDALFGYEDALRSAEASQPVWFVPETLAFILQAADDPTYPYLLILDEMNLAHVERYFADFLSGIESNKGVLPDLVQDEMRLHWSARSSSPTRLPLPRNLFVVGTVNIDETTYMFSPKVLDRASTFEFRVDATTLDPELGRPSAAAAAPSTLLRAICNLAEDDDWHRQNPHPAQEAIVSSLRDLHGILAEADLEFGHRTFYESLRFAALYAATGDDDVDHVMDRIIMQKLLPKVSGSRRRVEPVLTKLLAFSNGSGDAPHLPATHRKISRMLTAVRANQFVSFTE
jgi:MoxR-like ATPase